MLIRQAQASDAPAIAALYVELHADPAIRVLPERLTQLAADPQSHLLVLEQDTSLLATAHLTLCLDAMYGWQPYGVVENVVVASRARGQGLGAALMQAIDRLALQHDCSKLMLLSSVQRDEAHRFFEQQGYRADRKRGFVKYRRALELGLHAKPHSAS